MSEPGLDGDATILIVDDNTADQQLLSACLTPLGYALRFAGDGVEALEVLEREPFAVDVVLLDRQMPRMGGIEVLTRIKSDPNLRTLPVIMQTAASARSEILEGIRAGAYYYLTKPYDRETLETIVDTAARDFSEYKRLRKQLARGLGCLTLMHSATLSLRTLDHARDTAAVFANACPDPEAAVIGLTELLVNAIEHGNLGITYEEKTALNASGTWEAEVVRRLALPENEGKSVELLVERDDTALRFTIRDQGPGFPWNNFLEIDPKRAFDNHGRGIAISRAMSFDSIEYRGNGSEVVATVRLDPAR